MLVVMDKARKKPGDVGERERLRLRLKGGATHKPLSLFSYSGSRRHQSWAIVREVGSLSLSGAPPVCLLSKREGGLSTKEVEEEGLHLCLEARE